MKRTIEKTLASALALLVLFFGVPPVYANPQFSHTEAGDIQIEVDGSVYIIRSADKSIGVFDSFGNATGETINSIQAAANHTVLFRVAGVDPSVFFGTFNANSRVFLINPNGILFGAGSQVNATGLIASTLDLTNEDFLNENYVFTQDPSKAPGMIINRGDLEGDYIALVAGAVRNEGTITALNGGEVALAAGSEVSVSLDPEGLVSIDVNSPVEYEVYDFDGNRVENAIEHLGEIAANGGGYVVLTAKGVEQLFDNAINVSGHVSATSVVDNGGVIELRASDAVENDGILGWEHNLGKVEGASGDVVVTGTLDVSAEEAGAASGEVTVSGERVGVAGTILAKGAEDADGGDVLLTSTEQTVVTSTAVIDTSGAVNSSAGNTVIWSDNATHFTGTVLGTGGELAGDGADIEISGHNELYARGDIDLRAANGQTGSVLYDPLDGELRGGSADGDDDTDASTTNLINDSGSNTQGTIDFTDEGSGTPNPFVIYESEVEGTNADIVLRFRRSFATTGTFNNDGGEGNGVVLIQNNRSLTIETRNQTAADGSGSIDLTGSAHGNSLVFRTQGTGNITITGSTSGESFGNLVLSELDASGTGSINVTTNRGDITINGELQTGGTGSITVDSTGATNIGANLTTAGGAININDNVTLNSAVTLDSTNAGGTPAGAAITVTGTVDGAQDLTVDSGNAATTFQGNLGGTTALGDGTGAAITLNSAGTTEFQGTVRTASGITQAGTAGTVTFRDNVNVSGGDTNNTLNANVVLDGLTWTSDKFTTFGDAGTDTLTVSGAATEINTSSGPTGTVINSATTLNDDLTINAGTQLITLNGTVDGGNDLTLNTTGATSINGVVGGTTAINSLTTNAGGTTNIGANITADAGGIDINDATTLTAETTLATTNNGNLDFGSTVDGNQDLSLNVTGTTTFQGNVGATTGIGDGTGDAIDILSTGTTEFQGTVRTNSGFTQRAAAGTVTFRDNVTVENAGSTTNTFNANVVLDGLTFTSDKNTSFGNATSDTLTVSGATIVDTSTAGADVNLEANTTLNNDLTISAGAGNITQNGTVDGANDLTYNSTGTTDINANIGGTTALNSLTTNAGGTTNIAANLSTDTGNIALNNNVILDGASTWTTTNNGNLNVGGTLNGAQDLTLNVAGTSTFTGAVGGTTPLGDGTGAALTINSPGATEFQSTVATASGINQAGGAGAVTFRDNVTVAGGDTNNTFNANVVLDGLTFASDRFTTFGDAGTDTLTISGAATEINTTSGPTGVVLNSATTLNQNLTVDAGTQLINIAGTVDGGNNLTLNTTGTTAINGEIGGNTAIGDFTTNAGGTTTLAADITTAGGTITLNDNVSLNASTVTLDTTNVGASPNGANITIVGTTDADAAANNRSLVLNGGNNGDVTLTGNVGATERLLGLTISNANSISLPAIVNVGAGGLNLTSSSLTLNGNISTVNGTTAGDFTYNGNLILGDNITIDTNSTGTDGNITLNGNVDSDAAANNHGLSLQAGSGDATITGSTGAGQALENLDIDANNISVGAVTTRDGGIDLSATGAGASITLGGNLSTTDEATAGTVSLDGPVVLGSNVQIDTNGTGADADVTIFSTIDADAAGTNRDLTVDAGTSNVSIGNTIGGTNAVNNFTVTNSGNTSLQSVLTKGNVNVTATGATTLNGTQIDTTRDLAGNAGSVSFTGGVTLANNVSIDTDHATGTDNNVTFNNAVNADTSTNNRTLTVAAGTGTATFTGDVGTTQAVDTFNISGAGTANVAAVDTRDGGININATTINLTGGALSTDDENTAGALTLTGGVNLTGGDVSLDTNAAVTDAAVLINNTVDGGADLSVDSGTATTTFQGNVGGTTAIGDGAGAALTLTSTGDTTFNGTLTTASGVSATNNVIFRENVTLGAGDTASNFDANVTLDGLDFQSAGAVTFGNAATDTVTLSSGAVSITTTANDSNLTFNSLVDGAQDLTVGTDGTGTATFNAAVGGTTPLGDGTGAALTLSDGDTVFNSTLQTASGITQAGTAGTATFRENVTVSGGDTNNTFNSNVVLDGMTFASDRFTTIGDAGTDTLTISSSATEINTTTGPTGVVINSATTLNDDLTVNAGDQLITLNGTVDGGNDLTLNTTGATSINGIVGGTTAVNSLTTNAGGTTNVGANLTADAGGITFNDAVNLTAATIWATTGNGNLAANSTVDGAQDLTLNVTGTSTFAGNVGATTPLGDGTGAALTINSTGTTEFQGTVGTASGITQAGGAGDVTFRENVTVNGGNTANTLNANVVLDGLTWTSSQATTFGDAGADTLTVSTAATVIDTSAAGADVTLNAATTLNEDLTVNAGIGNISQSGTVNGANDLAYNATGNTNITGEIGGTTAVNSLTTNAGGTTNVGANLTADAGGITFNDNVSLTTASTWTTTNNGNLAANGTVDGGQDLTLNVAGTSTFAGNVGGTTPLGDGTGAAITINSPGTTEFQGTVGTASGITQAGGAGDVTFRENVTVSGGDTNNTFNANVVLDGLTFASDRFTTFGDAGTDTLTVSTAPTVIDTTSGPTGVIINSATTLNDDLTVSAGTQLIQLNGTVDGGNDLALNTTGITDINGTIGGTTAVNSVTTNAGGTTQISTNVTAGAGGITWNDAVTLDGASTWATTGNGNLAANSTVDGGQDLTLNVTGTSTFAGNVGGTTALGDGTGAAITINSTGTTEFQGTVGTASGITQANGAGDTTFRQDVTVTGGDTDNTLNANVVLDGMTWNSNQATTFGNAGTDTVTLSGGDVTLNHTGAAGAEDLTINSAVDGGQDLTISGTANTTVNGTVGATTPIGDGTGSALNLTSTGTYDFANTVRTASGINQDNAAGVATFRENVTVTGGDTGSTLNANVVLDGMTWNSAISSTFGNAGTDTVTLSTDDVTLNHTGGTLTINSATDGAQDLTISGTANTTVNGTVGATTPIGDGTGSALNLTSTGTYDFANTVRTASGINQDNAAGDATFRENVTVTGGDTGSTLNANVVLDGMTWDSAISSTFGNAGTDTVTLSAGDVTLNHTGGTLTINSATDGGQDLTISGTANTTVNGTVGATTPIGDGTGAALNLTSTGTYDFANTVRTASGINQDNAAGDATFRENVTVTGGDTANTLNANVVLDGMTWSSAVGSTFGNAGTDTVTLSAGDVTLNHTGGSLTVNSAVDGGQDLTISGTVNTTVNGTVGATTPIGDGTGSALNLTSTGTYDFANTVRTASGINQDNAAGDATFRENVTVTGGDTGSTLNANVVLDGMTWDSAISSTFGNAGTDTVTLSTDDVTLNHTGGTLTINSATDGAQDLTISGTANTTVNGTVGATTAIGDGTGAALNLTSTGTYDFANTVRTASGINQDNAAGDATFRENVTVTGGDTGSTLNANVVLDGMTWDSAISSTFGNAGTDTVTLSAGDVTLNHTGGTLTINSATDGGQDLTISGTSNAVVNGTVGATTPIGDGTGVALNLTTTGTSTFNNTVATASGINQDNAAGTARFNENVTVNGGDTANTLQGNVILGGMTWNSNQATTIGNAGTDTLTLADDDVTLNHTGGALLTINSATDGAQDLTISGDGNAVVNGTVGATTAIGDGTGAALNLTTTGTSTFNNTVRTASGINQDNAAGVATFRENVTVTGGDTASTLNANVVLDGMTWSSAIGSTFGNAGTDTVTLSAGPVTLNHTGTAGADDLTINSATDGAQDLTISGTANAVVNGTVGATTPIGDGTGVALNLTTTGTSTFNNTVATASGINQDNAAGTARFNGDVTVNGGDTANTLQANVILGGMTWNSNQASTFGNAGADTLTLADDDVTLNHTGGALLTINSATDGAQDLTISGDGNAVVNGTVGATTPIGDGTGVALNLTTTGTSTFNNTVVTASGINQAAAAGDVTFRENVTIGAGDTDSTFNADVILDGMTMNAARNVTFGDVVGGDQVTLSSGPVTINTTANNGSLTFNSLVDGAQNLTLSTVGTGDITFNAAVGGTTPIGDNATTNSLVITTADDVTFNSTVTTLGHMLQTTGTGTTTFNALATIGGNADVTNGAVTFGAAGQLNSNAGTGAVTLTALTGGITSGGLASDVIADSLIARAATFMATDGNPLLTTINNLEGTATTGFFAEDTGGGLTIGGIAGGAGVTGVSTTGGNLRVNSNGFLTVDENVANSGGGNITLQAIGAASDMTLNANVTATGNNGNTILNAGDDLTTGPGSIVSNVGTGTLNVTAGVSNADGQINMNATSAFRTEQGNQTINATGSIALAEANADSNGDDLRGDVSVTSTNGSITDSNDGVGRTNNITANQATLRADGDIGLPADKIEITARILDAASTGAGSLFLSGFGDIILSLSAPNGLIDFDTTGSVIINTVSAPNGQVTLEAGDDIRVSDTATAPHITSQNFTQLIAGGIIGTARNPLQIQMNAENPIIISAGGVQDALSANIISNLRVSNLAFLNTPPGLVRYFFNGTGTLPGSGTLPTFRASTASIYEPGLPLYSPAYGLQDHRYRDFPGYVDSTLFSVPVVTDIDLSGLDIPVFSDTPVTPTPIAPPAAPVPPVAPGVTPGAPVIAPSTPVIPAAPTGTETPVGMTPVTVDTPPASAPINMPVEAAAPTGTPVELPLATDPNVELPTQVPGQSNVPLPEPPNVQLPALSAPTPLPGGFLPPTAGGTDEEEE